MQDIMLMPLEEKMEIYESMLDTIQSPFEFVDFTFSISGVSRSFTHQLVRTRNASYAQESLRAVKPNQGCYNDNQYVRDVQNLTMYHYNKMIECNVPYQDAREALPSGIKTSIVAKINLRELGLMAEKRLCVRTAGEYQRVFGLMKKEVVEIYPWLENYIEVYCVKHGTCCFPRYKECPVRETSPVHIPTKEVKAIIKDAWKNTNHVANPEIRK